MTDKARELLERTAEILELLFEGPNDVDPNTLAMLGDTRLDEIRAYLAVEKEAEPVAWVHCKGDYRVIKSWSINDDHKVRGWTQYPLYLHPPRPEPARKPLPEKIDPILRILGSTSCSPSYVAGWNNCIDAMSNGAEARKPMTKEEIARGFYSGRWLYEDFEAGIRFAEKHHGIEKDVREETPD